MKHYDNTFLAVWYDTEEEDEWTDNPDRLLATWVTTTFFFYADGFVTDCNEVVLSTN